MSQNHSAIIETNGDNGHESGIPNLLNVADRLKTARLEVIQQTANVILSALEPPIQAEDAATTEAESAEVAA